MMTDRLKRVIAGELGLADFTVTETTKASDIPGWDSLAHVRILFAVEAEFHVRFSTMDVMRLATVMDLQRLVDAKTKA